MAKSKRSASVAASIPKSSTNGKPSTAAERLISLLIFQPDANLNGSCDHMCSFSIDPETLLADLHQKITNEILPDYLDSQDLATMFISRLKNGYNADMDLNKTVASSIANTVCETQHTKPIKIKVKLSYHTTRESSLPPQSRLRHPSLHNLSFLPKQPRPTIKKETREIPFVAADEQSDGADSHVRKGRSKKRRRSVSKTNASEDEAEDPHEQRKRKRSKKARQSHSKSVAPVPEPSEPLSGAEGELHVFETENSHSKKKKKKKKSKKGSSKKRRSSVVGDDTEAEDTTGLHSEIGQSISLLEPTDTSQLTHAERKAQRRASRKASLGMTNDTDVQAATEPVSRKAVQTEDEEVPRPKRKEKKTKTHKRVSDQSDEVVVDDVEQISLAKQRDHDLQQLTKRKQVRDEEDDPEDDELNSQDFMKPRKIKMYKAKHRSTAVTPTPAAAEEEQEDVETPVSGKMKKSKASKPHKEALQSSEDDQATELEVVSTPKSALKRSKTPKSSKAVRISAPLQMDKSPSLEPEAVFKASEPSELAIESYTPPEKSTERHKPSQDTNACRHGDATDRAPATAPSPSQVSQASEHKSSKGLEQVSSLRDNPQQAIVVASQTETSASNVGTASIKATASPLKHASQQSQRQSHLSAETPRFSHLDSSNILQEQGEHDKPVAADAVLTAKPTPAPTPPESENMDDFYDDGLHSDDILMSEAFTEADRRSDDRAVSLNARLEPLNGLGLRPVSPISFRSPSLHTPNDSENGAMRPVMLNESSQRVVESSQVAGETRTHPISIRSDTSVQRAVATQDSKSSAPKSSQSAAAVGKSRPKKKLTKVTRQSTRTDQSVAGPSQSKQVRDPVQKTVKDMFQRNVGVNTARDGAGTVDNANGTELNRPSYVGKGKGRAIQPVSNVYDLQVDDSDRVQTRRVPATVHDATEQSNVPTAMGDQDDDDLVIVGSSQLGKTPTGARSIAGPSSSAPVQQSATSKESTSKKRLSSLSERWSNRFSDSTDAIRSTPGNGLNSTFGTKRRRKVDEALEQPAAINSDVEEHLGAEDDVHTSKRRKGGAQEAPTSARTSGGAHSLSSGGKRLAAEELRFARSRPQLLCSPKSGTTPVSTRPSTTLATPVEFMSKFNRSSSGTKGTRLKFGSQLQQDSEWFQKVCNPTPKPVEKLAPETRQELKWVNENQSAVESVKRAQMASLVKANRSSATPTSSQPESLFNAAHSGLSSGIPSVALSFTTSPIPQTRNPKRITKLAEYYRHQVRPSDADAEVPIGVDLSQNDAGQVSHDVASTVELPQVNEVIALADVPFIANKDAEEGAANMEADAVVVKQGAVPRDIAMGEAEEVTQTGQLTIQPTVPSNVTGDDAAAVVTATVTNDQEDAVVRETAKDAATTDSASAPFGQSEAEDQLAKDFLPQDSASPRERNRSSSKALEAREKSIVTSAKTGREPPSSWYGRVKGWFGDGWHKIDGEDDVQF